MSNKGFLKNSIIIGAHPDDEVLWFSSIIEAVDQVVIVYENYWPDPSLGSARAEALVNYPRNNVLSLKLDEAVTYGCADWKNPVLSPIGIEFGGVVKLRDIKKTVKRMMGKSLGPRTGIQACYQNNHDLLVTKLRTLLTSDMNVFSHNPWGEYGHEDHVQIYQVLNKLRDEIGFTMWMSNYCTDRSMPLAMKYFEQKIGPIIQLPTNKMFAERIAQNYRDAGCWTWKDDWQWFDSECFMETPTTQSENSSQGHLFPLNFFNI